MPNRGPTYRPGGPVPVVEQTVLDTRVTTLVERGLQCYGRGDLRGAMSEWEHALALEPDNPRATEYTGYVRDNFELLAERFEVARRVAAQSAALDVPFGLESVGDEIEAYEALSVEAQARRAPPVSFVIDALDEGWVLDDFVKTVPSDRPAPAELGAELRSVNAALLELSGDFEDDETVAQQEIGGRALSPSGFGASHTIAQDDFDAEQTVERHDGGVADRASPTARGVREVTMPIVAPLDDSEPTTPGKLDRSPSPFAADLPPDTMARVAGLLSTDSQPLAGESRTTADDTTQERIPTGGRSRRELDTQADDMGPALSVRFNPAHGEADEGATVERTYTQPERVTRDLDELLSGLPAPELSRDSEAELLTATKSVEPEASSRVTRDFTAREILIARESGASSQEPMETRETREFDPQAVLASQTSSGPITGVGLRPAPKDDAGLADEIENRLLAEVDELAISETGEERVRTRIGWLLDRAERDTDPRTSVLALDLALAEEPESAAAQKLIHRRRDMILDTYQSYFGDMQAAPAPAIPMHEVTQQKLDSRAAFLLSRIDGSLTFEEILDVSGMTRLEACRHMAKMLVRGILEVR